MKELNQQQLLELYKLVMYAVENATDDGTLGAVIADGLHEQKLISEERYQEITERRI